MKSSLHREICNEKNNHVLLPLAVLCILGIAISIIIVIVQHSPKGRVTISAPGTDESTQMVGIVKSQPIPAYADVACISQPAVLKAHKSKFYHPSVAGVQRFSIIAESAFDEECVRQLAENLRKRGALTDYSIENVYGGFKISNTALSASHSTYWSIDGDKSAIWEAVLQDSGLEVWLDTKGLQLKSACGVLRATYQLFLRGTQSLDYVNIELENSTLVSLTVSIHDYFEEDDRYELLPLEEALKNAVFLDLDGQISEKELHVYRAMLVYADSFPVYFLNAYAIKEDGHSYGTHYIGLAIPFTVETEEEIEDIRNVLRQLPEWSKWT